MQDKAVVRVRADEDQARMDKWAADRGWCRSQGRCLHWVSCGRCAVAFCRETRAEHPWMDHVTGWAKDGQRMLLCQPYHLHRHDLCDLVQVAERLDLEVAIHGDGWYGYGTVAVELSNRARKRNAN